MLLHALYKRETRQRLVIAMGDHGGLGLRPAALKDNRANECLLRQACRWNAKDLDAGGEKGWESLRGEFHVQPIEFFSVVSYNKD